MVTNRSSSDPVGTMKSDAINLYNSKASPIKRKAHVGKQRRLAPPNDKQAYRTSQYGVLDHSGSSFPSVAVQKCGGNIQDSMPTGHHLTHNGVGSGPATAYPDARSPDRDARHVAEYGYSTSWLNSDPHPEPASSPPNSPAGGIQENASSYTSDSKNASGLRDNTSCQGHSMHNNARSSDYVGEPQNGVNKPLPQLPTTSPSIQTHNEGPNTKGNHIIATASRPSSAAEELNKDFINVSVPKINIVIFGETGVGKSSVINLIADEKRAHTSNGALGCTFKHERHDITLGGVACTFWDTTGLDEGSEGTVPADVAEKNLRVLLEELAYTEGIHLVIYCIRAARLTKVLKRNYELFYVGICRRKVPVALVAIGLEHQEGEMETWWHANEGTLRQSGMRFDAHACVTTLNSENQTIQNRRSESRSRLHDLVLEYSGLPPWKIAQSFPSSILSTLHAVLRRNLSAGIPGNIKTTRKVIICDMTKGPQTVVHVSPGITALCQRSHGMIGDKQYEFVRVDQPALGTALRHEDDAGVLVFYTSILAGDEIPQKDVTTLRTFYNIARGHTCPVIVVLRGCDNEETAHKLWRGVTLHHSDIRAHLTFLPNMEDDQSKLNEMIERLCIEHMEVIEPGKASKGFFQTIGAQFSQVTEFMKRTRQFASGTRSPGGEARMVMTTEKVERPASGVGGAPDGGEIGRGMSVENTKYVSDVQSSDGWGPSFRKSTETTKELASGVRELGSGKTDGGKAAEKVKQLTSDAQAPDGGGASLAEIVEDVKYLAARASDDREGEMAAGEAKQPASGVQESDGREASGGKTDEKAEQLAPGAPESADREAGGGTTADEAKQLTSDAQASSDGEEATTGEPGSLMAMCYSSRQPRLAATAPDYAPPRQVVDC